MSPELKTAYKNAKLLVDATKTHGTYSRELQILVQAIAMEFPELLPIPLPKFHKRQIVMTPGKRLFWVYSSVWSAVERRFHVQLSEMQDSVSWNCQYPQSDLTEITRESI